MNLFIVISILLAVSPLAHPGEVSFDQKTIIRCAILIDAIHTALLLSDLKKEGVFEFEYLGITKNSNRPPGFLQSLPGTWRIKTRIKNGNESEIFYLSMAADNKGFECTIPKLGNFKLNVTDEKGSDASSRKITLNDNNIPIKGAIQEALSKFNHADGFWHIP